MIPAFADGARQGAGRVRAAGARARAGRAGQRRAACGQALVREVGRGRGLLPQRRHRGARRLQGARTRSTRLPPIAKLDGPLQDDAALALGKIGDKRALETLAGAAAHRAAAGAARRSPRRSACSASTATSHENYLIETLKFADKNPGFQELLRGAAAGLGALARRRPRRGGRRAVRDRHPVARSDARAGRARRWRRSRCATRR